MNSLLLGAAIDFGSISLPFSADELVISGGALLGIIGPFVLLGLAFVFIPKLINVIYASFDNRNSYEGKETASRDQYGNRKHFQSPEAKAHFERFKKEKGWK